MENTTIQVIGMSCQHCVKAVEGALRALNGVRDARVNLEAGTVDVSYDSANVTREDMKAAIEDHGYDVA